MKKLIPFLSLTAFLLVFSCKKDPLPPNTDCLGTSCDTLEWSMPSTIGSYWIYEWFVIDSNGVETTMGTFDTLRIIGDTIVNGKVYSTYKGNHFGTYQQIYSYRRDSSGYVVNDQGKIIYSMKPTGETLNKVLGQFHNYISEVGYGLENKTVPAGTFETIPSYMWVSKTDGTPITTCGDLAFNLGEFYSPTQGMIASRTAFITEIEAWCQYREGRLIEYYISP